MNYVAERIAMARKMAGLSLQGLSDLMGGLVTKQSLSKYEKEETQPDTKVIEAIAAALNVRLDFFLRGKPSEINKIEFRKKMRLSATDEEMIRQQAIDFVERYEELEELTGSVLPLVNPVADRLIRRVEDVEAVADCIRVAWKLGEMPIANVIETLEEQGFKVLEVDAPEEFRGLSGVSSRGSNVIVLNTRGCDNVRKRFTAIHEAAHILPQFDPALSTRERETLCHALAGAILIPRSRFVDFFGYSRRTISIAELKQAKELYGISCRALIARAKNIGVISEQTLKGLFIALNRMVGPKGDPGKYKEGCHEKVHRFDRLLMRAVSEEVISMSKAAALNKQSLGEFRESLLITE